MSRNPNFCLVPVTPRYVVVSAWLGLVQMILLAQTIRNFTVAAGTAGTAEALGWLCFCPQHESQHSGVWAVPGSGPCTPVFPMAFPQGLWLNLCLWEFLLGWLGETRDMRSEWTGEILISLSLLLSFCFSFIFVASCLCDDILIWFFFSLWRKSWMLTDMASRSVLGIFLLLMCYINSSCPFTYSGSTPVLPVLTCVTVAISPFKLKLHSCSEHKVLRVEGTLPEMHKKKIIFSYIYIYFQEKSAFLSFLLSSLSCWKIFSLWYWIQNHNDFCIAKISNLGT